ncbi:MAG: hypothetical protein IJI01_08500 [Butyrivibrio sp.]|uniref:O-antigen ligase family protein n=1 Tax=Butyrivibrio sp. TaxID=28121 RepID=UPI0025C60602|nr:hypothetical protein [Butyrivibrio sp.]MBQ6588704.1 hypothetical protein [Butyrivibrio sp.]
MNSEIMRKFKDNRQQIGEGIYLLYFAVMIGARAAGLYEGMTIYNLSLVCGLGLFALKMLVTQYSLKEYAVCAGFLLLSGIVYYKTGEKGLIVCFCTMLGMKGVSVMKVVKTGIIVSGVIILVRIFTGAFGLVNGIYYPQVREGVGLMFRESLGYAHPNTLHMNVLMLTMLCMYFVSKALRGDKVRLLMYSALAFLFNLYVFQFSGSRTGLLGCIAFLIVNFWFSVINGPRLFEKLVCYAAFPIACFLAIVFPFILPESIFEKVDTTIFTTRLSIARYFWENNSVSLFGIRLNNPHHLYKTYGIDMAQLYLFLQLGLVAFAVISVLTIWFIHKSLKAGHMQELAVLMGMLFIGIWEPLLYNLGFKNFVYIFMGSMMFNSFQLELASPRISGISSKVLGRAIAFGAVAGVCGMMLFYLLTSEPAAFYGNREADETGKSLGMEAIYLTETEVSQLKADGDIVVGYVDAQTPMYKYDSSIAGMEYERRGLSIAIYLALFIIVVQCLFVKINKNFRNGEV